VAAAMVRPEQWPHGRLPAYIVAAAIRDARRA
jgi:hypothetical protein